MEFIWILLIIFVFVYSAASKVAKEQKRLDAQNSQEESIDNMFDEEWDLSFLEDEILEHNKEEEISENRVAVDEIKPEFNEGESSIPNLQVSVPQIKENEPNQKGENNLSGIKERLKENPKDFVVLGEVLKPKYKEY